MDSCPHTTLIQVLACKRQFAILSALPTITAALEQQTRLNQWFQLSQSKFLKDNLSFSKLIWIYPPVTPLLTTCLMEQQSKTQLKMERTQRDEIAIRFILHARLIVSQPFKCSESSCHFQEDKKCKSSNLASKFKISKHMKTLAACFWLPHSENFLIV